MSVVSPAAAGRRNHGPLSCCDPFTTHPDALQGITALHKLWQQAQAQLRQTALLPNVQQLSHQAPLLG
jgi:hypothetical protein